MQSKNNLERLAVILTFLATRILTLRFIKEVPQATKKSCEQLLPRRVWQLLWLAIEKRKLPSQIPNMEWAYRSLAILAGWKDSKRNGRAACKTLWQGWLKLQIILEGYELASKLPPDL